jgi:PAS domain S-box-containing protein
MSPDLNEFSALFAPEPSAPAADHDTPAWKVLLVDDEPDIHAALHLAMRDMEVEGLPLRLFDARSAGEAKALLAEHPDIALVLLDVVMETEQAGLALVRHIRHQLGNRMVQIVLVTGQPGYAPEREVVTNYEIDGYRLKSELTSDKIFVSVYAALRTYQALRQLARQRELLEEQARTLRESEERLRSVLETAPDAIILSDATGTITGWNNGAEHLFGHAPEDMLGQSLTRVIPERHRAGHRAAMERIAAGGQPCMLGHSMELEGLHKDGGERSVELVLGSWETPTGRHFSAVIRDISERKRNEAELQRYRHHLEQLVEERTTALSVAKEAAEAANRAKSIFLANMSHELRTPMNAILGMTAMVLRHATDPKQIDQLTKASQASHRLLGIINDILDISKIEAERLSLEQVVFKLGGVLENLTSLTAQQIEAKGLSLDLDIAPELVSLPLLGDPLRLGQILLNLTGNAIKFTAEGAITLRVRPVQETPADVLLRFEVRDSGIGISPEDQKRLFNAFEQADGSTTRKYGGTGLGLAISKRLSQMMGGAIGVESQVGSGSTFWFTAKLTKMVEAPNTGFETTATSAEVNLRSRFSGTRILLVEDEPINQEVSRELLEDAGLHVELAEDGAEAVAMARQKDYSLILMDLQMPTMSGTDAARAIRAIPGLEHTPILAMTANAFDEDRQACLEAGMNDHIGKPVDPDKLYETLLKWLQRPVDQ